ncbi:hypothetical protein AXG93_319s1020 [Marchantia polymorpha subsp. ruderalis]|uniref:Uncharacterized protein n=1 Tax=Marchantia polymorpha subsp. ruderalis TaxID=1480154 RepID=A0A176W4K5_MARPO|nr:hypothetical protein AXG93_319s1020 [Marchantia polymorpha subsp. ruderalis]
MAFGSDIGRNSEGLSQKDGILDVEMVSSAPSIDIVHSAVNGSSESSERGSNEDLVPRSMEAVKDTGSEGACEMEHARANHPATVPDSVQEIGEPLDAPSQEHVNLQVSGLKAVQKAETIQTPTSVSPVL